MEEQKVICKFIIEHIAMFYGHMATESDVEFLSGKITGSFEVRYKERELADDSK